MINKNKNIKFAFWGTPEVASLTLSMLIESGYIPSVVITAIARPVGRGLVLTPTPVQTLAESNKIPVLTPEKIDESFIQEFKNNYPEIELSIVVAYGKILPQNIIDFPTKGTINIHYSLLPKYRGASPVESALLNGDTETGVSIQRMVFKLDAGDIIAEAHVPISETESKEELREILITEGAKLLINILPAYIAGEITPIAQDENLATHCGKIKKEDGEINPEGNAKENYNKYRAYSGWPGVYFFKDGIRIKITKAKYENDSFVIDKIIPEGKKEIEYTEFLKK